jgi:hypothetical protein
MPDRAARPETGLSGIKVEITPAMIEAGAEVLRDVASDEWYLIHRSKDQLRLVEIVTDVYRRMCGAK